MKISLGQSNKLYTHKHRPTCNTSASFGDVQPIFCKKLHGKDSINVNLSNFVRLMPMPYPSLANIKLKTVGRFVPCGDIAPWYDNYLSQTPFFQNNASSFVPLHQPNIKVSSLWALLFQGSTYFATYVTSPTDDITPLNADYVEQISETSFKYYRLTQQGYIVYRTLLSLGYRPSPTDDTLVNVMPLFAYCKVLWDVFGVKSNFAFEDTALYSAIQKLCLNGTSFNTDNAANTLESLSTLFYFIGNSSYCTLATDWLSAHQVSPYGGLSVFGHGEVDPDDDTFGTNSSISPVHVTGDSTKGPANSTPELKSTVNSSYAPSLTKIQLNLLSRLTQMFAKDSVIGLNIKEYIEKRFGSAISNQLYAESYFAGKSIAHINVSDVDSLADTADTTGSSPTGSYLGSYAGKGIGSGNGQFSIKADKDGYFILIQWIEPEEDYYSFLNPELQYYTQADEARPEYDALGYELTPLSCAWTDNQIAVLNDKVTNSDSFGYIPRYSGWKYIPNIVSGDLRLRRYENEMKTFYLDRDPIFHQLDTSGSTPSLIVQKSPKASEVWRYIGKYPQLQNFNRIFYNSEFSVNSTMDPDGNVTIGKHVPDNFIIHNVLDVTLRNHLKPMALSYDTFIDDVDNHSTSVSQS